MSLPPEEEPLDSRATQNGDARAAVDDQSVSTVYGDEREEYGQPSAQPLPEPVDEQLPFPVVGIGASAGGLDALRHFFEELPDEPGMAFIIVQHLSPEHESHLAELLQAHTTLSVSQVTDSPDVRADHVYVIPPGKSLRIDAGRLSLSAPDRPRGHRAPIDLFFRSLAADQGDNAAVIVLSGTGSDGALGLRAVKEAGGFTLAQTPENAAYDGMPKSAVRTGLVDVTAPVSDLGRRLVEVYENAERIPLPTATDETEETEETLLSSIFAILRKHTGHDFSSYKCSTVRRRIARRLQVCGLDRLDAYVDRLRDDPEEGEELLADLLISVTAFFRDPNAFAALEAEIPTLFAGKGPGDAVRVWVPGCATGEEAYSLAILLREHASLLDDPPAIQIFATDIDADALEVAREGLYPETIAADVSLERLHRFFQVEGGAYRVKKDTRKTILFAPHNLIKSPPFSRLDLVSCRNLLIYLQRGIQEQVFDLFHYALLPGGLLFLGMSENVGGVSGRFVPLDKKQRLFRRWETKALPPRLPYLSYHRSTGRRVPGERRRSATSDDSTLEERYAAYTLAQHAPPRLLIDRHYEVTHVFGDAGRFLTEPEGRATQNVLQRVPAAIRPDLRTALYGAIERDEASSSRFVRLSDKEGTLLRLHAAPVPDLDELIEVVFDVYEQHTLAAYSASAVADDSVDSLVTLLEEELESTRRRLQTAVEEHETSDEKLRASNEELQSMNEELQSTAEELETGKEELQSMNEELITVNQELKTKIDELGRAYSDLQNLMEATEIASLFLDRSLRVKRYTPRATDVFHLILSDVGRPFAHITHRLDGTDLLGLAERVLDTLETVEEEVRDRDGGWYLLRLLPYRTVEDVIDGVVVTLVEVTELKETEHALMVRAKQQAAVAALGQRAVGESDLDALFAEACNHVAEVLDNGLCKVLELTPDRKDLRLRIGVGWHEGYEGQATVPNDTASQAGYTLVATEPVIVEDVAEETRFSAPALLVEHHVVSGMSVPIAGSDGPWGLLGTHNTERRVFTEDDARFLQAVAHILGESIRRVDAESALRISEAANREHLREIEAIYKTAPVGMAFFDRDLRYRRINTRLAEINGKPVEDHLGRTIHEVVPALAPNLESLLQNVIDTGTAAHDLEIRGYTEAQPDVERVWLASYAPHHDGEGNVIGLNAVVRDITQRKRIEEALVTSRAALEQEQKQLEDILQQLPIGVLIADASDERLRFSNDAARRLGQKTDLWQEHGGAFDKWRPSRPDLTPYDDADLPMMRAIRDGETISGEENLFRSPDGLWLTFRIYAGPIRDAEGRVMAGVVAFEDVTEEKNTLRQLESIMATLEERVSAGTEQVRALTSALSMAEQHERARLAHVLHDDLQQVLYGLRLRLQGTLEDLPQADAGPTHQDCVAVEEGLEYADSLLGRALRITRTLALDLKPPVLSDEGLGASLSWLAQHTYETYGLDVAVTVRDPIPLTDQHLHVLLFQLVRELLFNVVKHADVEEADVALEVVDLGEGKQVLQLIVEDRGTGFDVDALTRTDGDWSVPGFGLYSVKERLSLVGGHMDATSSPEMGTRVVLTLPLEP